jgi:hypothetical protein
MDCMIRHDERCRVHQELARVEDHQLAQFLVILVMHQLGIAQLALYLFHRAPCHHHLVMHQLTQVVETFEHLHRFVVQGPPRRAR